MYMYCFACESLKTCAVYTWRTTVLTQCTWPQTLFTDTHQRVYYTYCSVHTCQIEKIKRGRFCVKQFPDTYLYLPQTKFWGGI